MMRESAVNTFPTDTAPVALALVQVFDVCNGDAVEGSPDRWFSDVLRGDGLFVFGGRVAPGAEFGVVGEPDQLTFPSACGAVTE